MEKLGEAGREGEIMTNDVKRVSAFRAIRAIDYTVILARDWDVMRQF